MPIVMRFGMMILMIGNPLLGGVFFLTIRLYRGRVRNKMLHLDRPQKLSIAPWLRLCWLLANMRVYLKYPMSLWCANKSVIYSYCSNSVFHERTKHIKPDCHFTHHHL